MSKFTTEALAYVQEPRILSHVWVSSAVSQPRFDLRFSEELSYISSIVILRKTELYKSIYPYKKIIYRFTYISKAYYIYNLSKHTTSTLTLNTKHVAARQQENIRKLQKVSEFEGLPCFACRLFISLLTSPVEQPTRMHWTQGLFFFTYINFERNFYSAILPR